MLGGGTKTLERVGAQPGAHRHSRNSGPPHDDDRLFGWFLCSRHRSSTHAWSLALNTVLVAFLRAVYVGYPVGLVSIVPVSIEANAGRSMSGPVSLAYCSSISRACQNEDAIEPEGHKPPG